MIPELLIKQVNLVVEHLDTHQYRSLIMAAPTYCFIQAGLRILSVLVLVRWVVFHRLRIVIGLVEEEWQQNQVVVEVLQQTLVYTCEIYVRSWRFAIQVILKPEFSHKISWQILNFHSIGPHEYITTYAISLSIRRLLYLLLSLIIVHTELDQIHFFKNLEVHIYDFFAKERSIEQTNEIFFLHDGLEIFEDFSQLKRVSFGIVLREGERIIWGTTQQKLLILFESIQPYNILANLILAVVPLHLVSELYELVGEHVVQELLERLVRFVCATTLGRAHEASLGLSGCSPQSLDVWVSGLEHIAVAILHIIIWWQQISHEHWFGVDVASKLAQFVSTAIRHIILIIMLQLATSVVLRHLGRWPFWHKLLNLVGGCLCQLVPLIFVAVVLEWLAVPLRFLLLNLAAVHVLVELFIVGVAFFQDVLDHALSVCTAHRFLVFTYGIIQLLPSTLIPLLTVPLSWSLARWWQSIWLLFKWNAVTLPGRLTQSQALRLPTWAGCTIVFAMSWFSKCAMWYLIIAFISFLALGFSRFGTFRRVQVLVFLRFGADFVSCSVKNTAILVKIEGFTLSNGHVMLQQSLWMISHHELSESLSHFVWSHQCVV